LQEFGTAPSCGHHDGSVNATLLMQSNKQRHRRYDTCDPPWIPLGNHTMGPVLFGVPVPSYLVLRRLLTKEYNSLLRQFTRRQIRIMGNQISMILSLFFSQIPARTAHCNKMMNCSQSKVKTPMTTTTRGQSAATR
jgi:hypothetical protein